MTIVHLIFHNQIFDKEKYKIKKLKFQFLTLRYSNSLLGDVMPCSLVNIYVVGSISFWPDQL